MQTKAKYPTEVVSLTAVGLAFAGSALFVLGFHALVDTPHPGALAADLRQAASAGRSLLQSVESGTDIARAKFLGGPLYAADGRTEQWVRRNLPGSR